ncbi:MULTISPECIES: LPS-assembly protein LptD [Campylobacter]|uniref:LPS-assembly protein LptD n=1 Tax=Campylobacter TaxID=194 RepID=UPI00027A355A|nr:MULTISPECIES: LPS assembly protein LptD [Campylobacter]EJP75376.1 organic solvent tolerance protein [Campylobacter sp. FOBRC14]
MFFRIFIFISLCLLQAFAATEDVQLLADDVKQENGIVTANKNVVVYSQNYLVTADCAVYDQNSSIIELFGNVNMMKGKSEISRSNYAKLNLKNNDSAFEALFMMNKDMEVWMRSDESSSDSEYYRTKGAIVSSCNVQDPDWSITSSSAILNKQSKFLHMFNPVFHIGSVPVFYLPYFGFSTDTTRRTGLLPPEFGYSKKEGFYYKQPIYFAPYNQWDLELDPQIRTSRGTGIYGAFRFADSPDSRGAISFGAFTDKQSYRNKQQSQNSNNANLKNRTHKGIGFNYERDKLVKYLTEADLQEGLWIDATKLNDIEYLNLKGQGDDYDSLVTSKFNYFIANDKHYLGAYAKYYIDTEKIGSPNENKDTLQELPTLQYHKFTDNIVLPNILYSLDLQSHRYDRRIGVTATQYEFTLPISLHIPLFDDLATFSFYENLYASHINYADKITSPIDHDEDKTADYVNNYHKFTLHTDLAKAYEGFFHTINFGTEYLIPGYNKGRLDDQFIYGDDYDYTKDNGKDYVPGKYENFLTQEKNKEEVSAYATQYFYTSEGRKFLRHSISQGYYTDDDKYSNLKNAIYFYPFSNLSIYNRLEYSHTDKEFKKLQSGLTYTHERFTASILHTMKKNSNADKDSYLTTSASLKLPAQYRLVTGLQYDLERDYTKSWRVGVLHQRKCWNYGLIFQKDIEPTTTTSGSAMTRKNGVYFTVNFYPMGGVHYDFSVEKDQNSGSN